MNFLKKLSTLFIVILPFFDALQIQEIIHTPLTNSQIFQSNLIGYPVPSKTQFDNYKEPIRFKYVSSFSGIRVTSDMSVERIDNKMKIEINNRLMKNTLIFEKIKPDILHIQFDSHLYVHIPRRIHLYILEKKLKELMNKIQNV
jgi:hypothetical protein